LYEFELNSCEKCIQTKSVSTDLRYLSISGCIAQQAIRPYRDV